MIIISLGNNCAKRFNIYLLSEELNTIGMSMHHCFTILHFPPLVKVYRGSTQIAAIKNGSTVTYTDKKANTNGTKYTYKIIASASVTGRSTLSKSVTTYCVARPAISTLTNSASKKMTVKWGKNAKVTGYQIQYCPDKIFKTGNKSVSITSASTVSKVIGSLAKGFYYTPFSALSKSNIIDIQITRIFRFFVKRFKTVIPNQFK